MVAKNHQSIARRLVLPAFVCCLALFTALSASAQTKKINDLKSQRSKIEQGIKQSQTKLKQTSTTSRSWRRR